MSDWTTRIAGSEDGFPATRWSVVHDASDPNSATQRNSLQHLAASYWKPVYAFFRRKLNHDHDQAKALTQMFFDVICTDKGYQAVSARHGRYRSFIVAVLADFEQRSAENDPSSSVPLEIGEGFEPSQQGSPEQVFRREWSRALLEKALGELENDYRSAGKDHDFEIFLYRDVNPPPDAELDHDALARQFKTSSDNVTNCLYRARQQLREKVLEKVRDTVTSEAEAEKEMIELFQE